MKDGGGPVSAMEAIYREVRTRILAGEFTPGQRLVEQTLAQDFGVSRTPVREAIRRLVHEGFVEKGSGYNTRVAVFPEDELAQLFEIRRRLEGYAAARAAKLATEDEVRRLRALADRMEALAAPKSAEDYAAISEANAEFHQIIYEAARSPRLTALMAAAVHIGVVAHTYRSYTEADLSRSARHHSEIVDAITAGAPEWAESVMSAHVLAAAASAMAAR